MFTSKVKYIETETDGKPIYYKISSNIEKQIINKLRKFKPLQFFIDGNGNYPVYYHNAPVHWGKVFDFIPFYKEGTEQPKCSSHVKKIHLQTKDYQACIICLLNSSLFYWYNWQNSNCRDLSVKNILDMPIGLDRFSSKHLEELNILKNRLMKDLQKHSSIYKRITNGIKTEFASFYPMYSKSIIDEIDIVLAKHFGFTDEELDYIINYDIKYRIGVDSEEDED